VRYDESKSVECSEFVTRLRKMTLRSALEDLKHTTLSTLSGLLAKLTYLASLRRGRERYEHWGMKTVHGAEAADRALTTAHTQIVTEILKTPLAVLEEDLEVSRAASAMSPAAYVKDMRENFDDLLPVGLKDGPSVVHLNSVLAALSSLAQHPAPATRSAS
jgi:hypothetical protein